MQQLNKWKESRVLRKTTMASKFLAVLYFTLLIFSTVSSATIPCKTPPAPIKFPPKGPPVNPFCPWDTVKLGACINVLGDLGHLVSGESLGNKCCPLLEDLTDAEVAACFCTVIKESVLGITTKWTVTLSLLVSSCKKEIPDGFKCV
ncbi:Bifunctional inhibitor/lipid-transfer protein/seed storage 2S albumin protein [Dioscorea alata]|uniref:Bifunctional inhibitor/lipid-transfer protein/seed storage 2S albumin protein n=1 Tax=Dioscorea alata TaxID=55571 RepID=A0ACB7WKU0_DIOAL|nr:Bifunctional inhibitor/lipid-transfer protein/seed storage 2S albumin protein [Dioscorea alata]